MNIIRNTILAAALLAAFPAAQAAVQSYSLSGSFDSGSYSGQGYSGSFSFDDATLSGAGSEWISLGSLSISLLGSTWTLANAAVPAEVGFVDGTLLGLSYSAENATISFTFVPGFSDSSDAFVAYDASAGLSGAGNVIFAPVPEPTSSAMLLAGLGMLGFAARRRARG